MVSEENVVVSGVEECARRDGKVVGKVGVLWRRLKWKSQVAQEEWCGVVQRDMVGGTDSGRRRADERFEMSSKNLGAMDGWQDGSPRDNVNASAKASATGGDE